MATWKILDKLQLKIGIIQAIYFSPDTLRETFSRLVHGKKCYCFFQNKPNSNNPLKKGYYFYKGTYVTK